MYLTNRHISRRTVLRGVGATVALPFLEAMRPARAAASALDVTGATDPTRLVCIEMVHGAAGSNEIGAQKNLWAPAAEGSDFDLGPSSLKPLEAYRDALTIVSNTDVRNAEAFTAREVGGDHFRSSATFLTQARPKQTEGSDVEVGISLDQMYAQRFGQDTPIPSMQLCIENVDQSGGCAYGYACVYTDTISWAAKDRPLPMVRDPRVAFDQLFGAGGTAEERSARRRADRSILDWITSEVGRLSADLGSTDRHRLDQYLEHVREVERRIHRIEAHNTSGETRELPEAPIGVPDGFEEHIRLMFDLQALAMASDMTRVFSFKMGRDGSARIYPESGVPLPFHPASHHGGKEDRVDKFAKINEYHVSMLPYFFDRLREIEVGDGNLLDKSLIIYGSPMGDSNLHNHKRCPLIFAGGANGKLQGNQHIKAPDGTPMANAMLSVMHKLGMDDVESFGDSTEPMTIT
ncbi:MAG: DUF1552 domain-containing protein [Acidobacteriota bacterium]